MANDIERLIRSKRGKGRLPPAEPRGDLSGKSGVGLAGPTGGGGGVSSGGIASPLTEQSRTYHPARLLTSSDGLFTIEVKSIKTINFHDDNDDDVDMVFADGQ